MTHPPAGWYADPQAPQWVRWWDGAQWTQHQQPAQQPPQQPWQPSGPRTEDGELLAGWWHRVGQYLIDSTVVQVALTPLVIPVQLAFMRSMQPTFDDLDRMSRNGQTPDPFRVLDAMMDAMGPLMALSVIVGVAAWCLYAGLMLRFKGQTLGMMALSLHLRPVEGPGQLPWGTIAKRLAAQFWVFVAYLLPGLWWLVVGAGLATLWTWTDALWAAGDKRRQTLHDKFAGTLLVRRP